MKTRLWTCVILLICAVLTPAARANPEGQAALDRFARDLRFSYAILDNKTADGFVSEIKLTMPATVPQTPWAIRVGFVTPLKRLDSDAFTLRHINGDNYVLTPKPGAIQPGTTYTLRLVGYGAWYNAFKIMPNAYVTSDGLQARTIESSRPVIDPQTGEEILPFHAPMTDEAKLGALDANVWMTPERLFTQAAERQTEVADPEIIILPTPVSVRRLEGAPVDLRRGISLGSGLDIEAVRAAITDLAASGFPVREGGVPIVVKSIVGAGIKLKGDVPPSGTYVLTAKDNLITIAAADSAGLGYALESLRQQAMHENGTLQPIDIFDMPRFGFRGLHIDLARNFQSKTYLLNLIEQMQTYKLNRLHLHLGDDEGWRLAITDLAELTDIGAKRCHDPAETTCLLPQLGAPAEGGGYSDGYLTAEDYIDIVKAARARHIEVLPSFDMPGHSRAAVQAMEARHARLMAEGQPDEAARYRLIDPDDATVYDSIQHYDDNTLNICIPSTYAFIEKVIDVVKAYHEAAEAPLTRYHIGADETAGAWKESKPCQDLMRTQNLTQDKMTPYFIEKVSAILAAKGIEPAGWSDGMGHVAPANMPPTVQSNSWGMLFNGGINEAHAHVNQGWDVVMSTPDLLYFDMPYAFDPNERGYDWASRATDLFKVFAFMPENLPANAEVMKPISAHPGEIADTTPLQPGRRITGMQGQLWSEGVRSAQIADYLLFPRVVALAERAWHQAPWEPKYVAGQTYRWGGGVVDQAKLLADWQTFNAKLKPHLAALDAAGVLYRVPVPGARISNGQLEALAPYGHLAIQYRTPGGEWLAYNGPVVVSGPVEVRTVAASGQRYSRTGTVNPG